MATHLQIVTELPINPNEKLTIKPEFAVAENSLARRIFDHVYELFYNPQFACWFAEAYLGRQPDSLQVSAMENILRERAPEVWFVAPKDFNTRCKQNVPDAVWGWTPRVLKPFTICLNSNLFWTINEFGTRSERQQLMIIAMGIITFLHEFAHYVVSHIDDQSPLSGTPNNEQPPQKLVLRNSIHEVCDYECKPDRDGREAGSRLETILFGGKPAYTVLKKNLHFPNEMVLLIGKNVPFANWEALLESPEVMFQNFPSNPPSGPMASTPCSPVQCLDCSPFSTGTLVPGIPEMPEDLEVYSAPPDMGWFKFTG